LIALFHWVYETGILFTHFFYVPIILSVIWWRKRGLLVALSLVVLLAISDVLHGDVRRLSDDALRGSVMIAIAMVVYTLNERMIGKDRELAEANQGLEEKIAERTGQLKRSNEELKEELRLRNEAESLLDRERKRLETTLRSIADGVVVTDGAGAVAHMNPGAEAMTGFTFSEAVGRPMREVAVLIDETTGEPISCSHGAEVLPEGSERRTVLVKRSGGRMKAAVSCAPIVMDGVVIGQVAVITDITERERLIDELWQQQHYHSIELLAGGIAHDFGNFLMSLNGNLELLKLTVRDQKGQERIETVQKASENALGLTKQLMAFSKVGTPSKEGTDIKETLVEVGRFNLAGSEVSLETQIDPELSEVNMDRTHLSQVVGNIIINAKQAMGGKGNVRITASNVHVSDSDRLRDGDYVRIEVRDDGPGMPAEVLKEVFEPYFTKKKEGAGLGMAITKYTISRHGGLIEAISAPGEGTAFVLHIPAASCQLRPGQP
jgi:PAS domain S-box-containing protein